MTFAFYVVDRVRPVWSKQNKIQHGYETYYCDIYYKNNVYKKVRSTGLLILFFVLQLAFSFKAVVSNLLLNYVTVCANTNLFSNKVTKMQRFYESEY